MFVGALAALMLFGIGAKAGKGAAHPLAAQTDSVENAKEETVTPDNSVVDEVIWVVGDEPILKSDVEIMRLQGEAEGVTWRGDPDCSIPEQIAVQKLFLHPP